MHDGSVVVEGDEITLLCETYPGIGLILWKKENETKMIEMNYNVRPYPAGITYTISFVEKLPNYSLNMS